MVKVMQFTHFKAKWADVDASTLHKQVPFLPLPPLFFIIFVILLNIVVFYRIYFNYLL